MSVEAGTSFGWERYVGRCGVKVSKDDFGASGPFKVLQEKFGFGRGVSCTGCGCGVILLVIFLVLACSVVTGTDWTQFGF